MGSIKGKGRHDIFTEDKLVQLLYREERLVTTTTNNPNVTFIVALSEKQNSALPPSGSLKAIFTPLLDGSINFVLTAV